MIGPRPRTTRASLRSRACGRRSQRLASKTPHDATLTRPLRRRYERPLNGAPFITESSSSKTSVSSSSGISTALCSFSWLNWCAFVLLPCAWKISFADSVPAAKNRSPRPKELRNAEKRRIFRRCPWFSHVFQAFSTLFGAVPSYFPGAERLISSSSVSAFTMLQACVSHVPLEQLVYSRKQVETVSTLSPS